MKRLKRFLIISIVLCAILFGTWIYQSYRDSNKPKIDKISWDNVYITKCEQKKTTLFYQGKNYDFSCDIPEKSKVNVGLADVSIENGNITKIRWKPDTIQGKVQKVTDSYIQIENYGKLPFAKNFQAYRYQEKESKVIGAARNEVLVGYSATRFVVAKGKIEGAILAEQIKAENIRVLLMTNGFQGYVHRKVTVSANVDYTIKQGKRIKKYKKGKKVKLSGDSSVVSTGGKGTIQVLEMRRGAGIPAYAGDLEVDKIKGGYTVINEVPLEQYIKGVVPSEMPKSFGLEALKAQAICARSYGYQQILSNKLRNYGAHVDDSTNFQVYNNSRSAKITNQAVDETSGMVVMSGKKVATTYFFSTSCGSTEEGMSVWKTKNPVPYLKARIQNDGAVNSALSSEQAFATFIDGKINAYDAKGPWYRWRTTLNGKSLGKKMGIGSVKRIDVVKRGKGGSLLEINVVGEGKTIRLDTCTKIRSNLNTSGMTFIRKDGSKARGLTMLPSSFFYIVQKGDSFSLIGGGYGHGVGMSQTGASAMAQKGKKFEEIIAHYYPSVSFLKLY